MFYMMRHFIADVNEKRCTIHILNKLISFHLHQTYANTMQYTAIFLC